jgi:hypothetical protein
MRTPAPYRGLGTLLRHLVELLDGDVEQAYRDLGCRIARASRRWFAPSWNPSRVRSGTSPIIPASRIRRSARPVAEMSRAGLVSWSGTRRTGARAWRASRSVAGDMLPRLKRQWDCHQIPRPTAGPGVVGLAARSRHRGHRGTGTKAVLASESKKGNEAGSHMKTDTAALLLRLAGAPRTGAARRPPGTEDAIDATAQLLESRYVFEGPRQAAGQAAAARRDAPWVVAGQRRGFCRRADPQTARRVRRRSTSRSIFASEPRPMNRRSVPRNSRSSHGKAVNHGFEQVRRFDGNIGYLDLRVFARRQWQPTWPLPP